MASGKPRINVVWFKCTDLRTHDHAALKAAHQGNLPVLHLYVFDPFWHAGKTRICGFPKTGAIRTRFQIECLADLQERLDAKGHTLNIRTDISTAACFEELCQDYEVNAVFAFREICSEELRVERQVRNVLRKHSRAALQVFWGFELYNTDDLSFDPKNPRGAFNSYTAFRKRVEEQSKLRHSTKEDPVWSEPQAAGAWKRSASQLPTVKEAMGATYDPAADPGEEKDPRAELRWKGGETAALARVREYIWDDDSLGLEYVGATMTMDKAKSCMRDKAMSKLSPFLAHGCLSPRRLYEEVKRYEKERQKTKSTYWITHELLWRDFVRFGSMHAGTSIFKIGGPQNQHPRWQWSTNREWLDRWIDGKTGFPFVDCFMRELKVTGYCNHMGRECAGWFLVGDLGLDWRMAAEWFETILIDYEPTANWYNWTYRCLPAIGRMHGNDRGPPPGEQLRGLEILKWGTQHDPDATYIKRWLPELAQLPSTTAREPWRLGLLDNNDGPRESANGLRPPPTGKWSVSRAPLEAVLAMGFPERDAAVALYRTREDPDAAVALLLGEGGNLVEDVADSEDEDMAKALAMSLGQDDKAKEKEETAGPYGGFRYGTDYPKPIIQPVSLTNTEEQEDVARKEQERRDQQIAAAKRRKGNGGKSFSRPQWEQSRQEWPAETPTAAKNNERNQNSHSDESNKSGGRQWRGGMRSDGHDNNSNWGNKGQRDDSGYKGSDGGGKGGGRRWGARAH